MKLLSVPLKDTTKLLLHTVLFSVITLVITSMPWQSAMAQTTTTNILSGQIKKTDDQPVMLASVGLLRAKDSALVKGEVTDSMGRFSFRNIIPGDYYLTVASMGYKNTFSAVFKVNGNMELPPLTLVENVQSLKAVDIVTKKPFIQQTPDKTILNVENSIVSKGGTAIEILEMAPGVNIDIQEKRISMRGREGVLIMIDNKPTYLSSQEALGLLSNMPANSIQSIELITNPSARYEAAGNSGIINIRLKKNAQLSGTNSSISAGIGYGRLPKLNGGITLNHRNNRWNFFSNYNADYRENFVQMNVKRLFYTTNGNVTLHTLGYWPSQDLTHTFKAGADYTLSKKQVLGVMINGNFSKNKNQLRNNNLQYNGTELLDNTAFENISTRTSDRIAANLNYRYTFSTADKSTGLRELAIDGDYSRNSIHPKDVMTTSTKSADLLQTNTYPSVVVIKSIKADYTHAVRKNTILEIGWKSSFVNSDNDVLFQELKQSTWTVDSSRTNHFVYEENIHAAYVNLNSKWRDWTLKAGVRMENTQSNGNSITEEKTFKRNYTNLFPSAGVSRNFGKNNLVGLSYSRRIDRPNYQDLNPFIYALDPFSDFLGNAFLLPQYTNSIQASYTYKNQTNVSIGYNHTSDVIVIIRTQDPVTNKLSVQPTNFGVLNNINLSIGFPLTLTKWWSMRQSADIYLNQYKYDQDVVPFKFEKVTASLKMNHNFTLPMGLSGELTGSYVSPRIAGVTYFNEVWQVNAGLQKSFWEKTASLSFTVSDIFHSIRFRRSVDYLNTHMQVNNYQDTRAARLTFLYNFGNRSLKPSRQRHTGVEEELKRVGSSN